ncbi:MAG: hypothetical protein SGJ02_05955 [bacterium]|nr:hypothetical protein [bacterium]
MAIQKNYKKEFGGATFELPIAMALLVLLAIGGADLVTIARYSSVAQWLAITAARVGSVSSPADGSTTPLNPSDLKIPIASANAYLPAYVASVSGCSLTPRHLKTINLVLGEARRILQNKAATASNWISSGDVSNPPEKGEFIVVPVNCGNTTADISYTEWKVCINVPTLFYSVYTCQKAASEVSGV